MNVQTEKLRLIEWLVGIRDKKTIEQLNEFREQNIKREYESKLKPMSIEELTQRAEASNKAIEQGEYYDVEDILKR